MTKKRKGSQIETPEEKKKSILVPKFKCDNCGEELNFQSSNQCHVCKTIRSDVGNWTCVFCGFQENKNLTEKACGQCQKIRRSTSISFNEKREIKDDCLLIQVPMDE